MVSSGGPALGTEPVLLGIRTTAERIELAQLHHRALDAANDLTSMLAVTIDEGERLPMPGAGRTAHLWSALATVAAADLTAARVMEPHLDALAILGQAHEPVATGAYGVFAAEGPGEPLRARADGGVHVLVGRKHWCSLAAVLDHALVSAWVGEDRQLFAVALRQPGVRPVPGTWVARGLAAVDSGPVDFDGVTARPIGEPGWYLDRPGFAWGGIGVAAVWYGGAVGVARRMIRAAGARRPDQIALAHLGAVDAALHSARCTIEQAASDIDGGLLAGAFGWRTALRVRDVVARVAEEVLQRAAHGLGPGPLATDEDHARRVADLELYLRQWHAERDQAALGDELLRPGAPAW